jgi:hypothetical protein
MSRLGKLWLIVLVLLAGCRSNAPSPLGIESFGLVESTVDRPTLLSAIQTADLVLGSSAPVRLARGWNQSQVRQSIRVFAVMPQGLSKRDAMTSYQQCHCVVAQVGRVTEWLKEQTGTGSGLLTIDLRDVLAYMLLHEAGHIANGDMNNGNAFDNGSGGGKFNLDLTTQKDRENAADRFAADAIASGITEKGTDRGLAAARLSIVLAQLSWNLAEHRLLDNFGGTEANLSSLFQDAGLSHPNLEWRILVVNDAISHSSTSQQLLNDFEEHRHLEPSILFQAPKP